MKYKNSISFLILILITSIGLWGIPLLVKKATFTPDAYPFVYYSSVLDKIALIDYKNKEFPMTDLDGKKYTTAEFDTLMPLLNFRQLMSDGRLPDSLKGVEITPQIIRSKNVVYRYLPKSVATPTVDLYFLFESMPKRVGLTMPNDAFRIKNGIEFVDMETNTINREKSERFGKELTKRGYQYPTQWAIGNPNTRKPYDEGYFCLDAKGDLFHIKMVNGRPFVRDTEAGKQIDIASFAIQEVADKRYYGYLFSKQGDIYILESNEGKYRPVKLDIPSINLEKDLVTVMGNLFYWTVSIAHEKSRDYYVLNTGDLKQIDSYRIEASENMWDKTSKWLFPYTLSFESSLSDYIYPRAQFLGFYGFAFNILLAILSIFVVRVNGKKQLFNVGFVALTGVAGLIGLLLIPYYRNN